MNDENPWMVTAGGRKVDLLEPQPEQIDIDDIAIHLSRLRRFTGASDYTVAEHSIWVSWRVQEAGEPPLAGLLHDAHEAYLGDISRPLKVALDRLGANGVLDELAKRFDAVIAAKFGLPSDAFKSPAVKYADNWGLSTERRDVLVPHDHEWTMPLPPPFERPVVRMSPASARVTFLARFAELSVSTAQAADVYEIVSSRGRVIHRTESLELAMQKAIVWFNAAHIVCDGKVVWTKEGSGLDAKVSPKG